MVLHAYPDDIEERPLEVDLERRGEEIVVVIRDQGIGIRPPRGPRPAGLRMGLLVVGAIASYFQLRSGRGRGTELLVRFPLSETS